MALTSKDLKAIENIVEAKVEQTVKRSVAEEIQQHIKNLPTRDEFFTGMSEVMGELQTIRQEIKALSHRQSIHSDQIEALEGIHPGGKHA